MSDIEKSARTAVKLFAGACLALGLGAGAIQWFVGKELAESQVVNLAREEGLRAVSQERVTALLDSGPLEADGAAARSLAKELAGGFFDVAEVYSLDGVRLAEHATETGKILEKNFGHHGLFQGSQTEYESSNTSLGWALRVHGPVVSKGVPIARFEGIRLVPKWQKEALDDQSLLSAGLAFLAVLAGGAALVPILSSLHWNWRKKSKEVLEAHLSMMEALGRAIAKRDSDTGDHNYRVAWFASRLGEEAGLAGPRMQSLIAGSFLHDAGKIGIPDAILLKPGKLDASEMEVMKEHVRLGEDIVSGHGWLAAAKMVISCHHEKWSGGGYPAGLSGEAIPLEARIFAIADVFDALCSKRPYKGPMAPEKAVAIIRGDSGTHFDPELVEKFDRIALDLHEKAGFGQAESKAQELMREQIQKHFGI